MELSTAVPYAQGATGRVLKATDESSGRALAIKVLRQDDPLWRARWERETAALRRLDHPHVCGLLEAREFEGQPALIFPFIDGASIERALADAPWKAVIATLIDVVEAVAHAHSLGVIHRDLKPANILVNDEGLLKIVDFGVAAAASSGDTQLTKTGYVIGSPKYMAPEQILGKKVDQTADIYSVGVIMYEMVTGIPPYSRGDHMSVMYQHVQGKAKHCQEINPDLPDDYAELIIKAMSVDKTKRHQSMEELTEGLDAIQL